jgi:NTE family protein
MRLLCVLTILCVANFASGQRVALVLSGGGAKGIAHLGVLKALEENNIPIDYIVGTSMGGIVGGIYAAGLSPAQIEAIVLSEEFLSMLTGQTTKGYNFHYYSKAITPDVLSVDLSLDSIGSVQFNTSIASDAALNFALTEITAQASAIAKNNFDSLFVPLRVMASDIFSQRQVILSTGSLSDALRATQTVPFFYTPIRVEGKYLFDGGIYNNFPVDVAEDIFSPDVVIGSNVSSKIFKDYPYGQDDKLLSRSLMYMLLDKSDPDRISESGIYIQPNLEGYSSLNFSQAKALIDSGYRQTLRQLEEIKKKIARRTSREEIEGRRNEFRSRVLPFVFRSLTFTDFSQPQSQYIRRIFNLKNDPQKQLTIHEIKEGYFKLVAEPYFKNVYPTIKFQADDESFSLQLAKRTQKNFTVDVGGMMATRNISNLYLGLNYYYFRKALTHAYVGVQTGSFYKSLVANTRFDFPFFGRFYFQPEVVFNNWDYVEGSDLIQKTSTTVLKRFDRKVSLTAGWPLGRNIKSAFNISGFNNADRYSNNKQFVGSDTLDILTLGGIRSGITFTANDLNRKQYASAGKSLSLGLTYFYAKEDYTPGSTSEVEGGQQKHRWFRIRGTAEQYFSRGRFRPGYYADVAFSNQPYFSNYFGTIINAPSFFPMQDSRTLILENFRSFNYMALGSRNVLILQKRLLDLRIEGYLFKPIEEIQSGPGQKPQTNTDLTKFYFAGTTGLVYHSPIGPISLSVNYYDDAETKFGVLFHAGFVMFRQHTFE